MDYDPDPIANARRTLERHKRRGASFDVAWTAALSCAEQDDAARGALTWAREHYEAAYLGSPATSLDRAATHLIA